MPELIPPLKPSRTYGFVSLTVLAVAAVVALAAAWGALVAVERSSKSAVDHGLFLAGEDWAEVETNGLQVFLSGKAPSEAARFAALSAAAHEVDGARVIDQMVLPEAVALEPPRFSIEMLRNEAGISLIGLIPAETDHEAFLARMRAIDPITPVADFLETADHPTPESWDDSVDFLIYATSMLPRSKISLDAERIAIEGIASSPAQKDEWEKAIRRERPAGLRLALDIRAPLDVVSPYIVRFLSDDQGTRFDACTAYTVADRNRIVAAGIAAGVKGAVACELGLGVPSPDWPDAVARGIRAVRELRGGSLTFSDADVTLIALEDTPQDSFDRVLGELEADLPDVFSLHGVLPVSETGTAAPVGPPEFIATLAKDGAVQLRGRVASEQDRTIVKSLARARFGTGAVYAPLRLDPGLPPSWAVRTLAGLKALDQLADGRVVVRPDVVTVSGVTGDKGASAKISRLLSDKLGEAEDFRVNVTYEEALDPVAALPTPQECVADIKAALAHNKITFAPGSAEIELSSVATIDKIADVLKSCPDVAMEIGGYTDSQGREEMNQALSQRRAEAVVSALLARRVLTTNLTAFGYGEEFPIADNDTDDGREANRRIEFRLVGETRPRGDPPADAGEAPTIRPPSRPAHIGSDDSEGGAAAAGSADETGAEAGTVEGGAAEGPEAPRAVDPEVSGDADEAPDNGIDADGAATAAGDEAVPAEDAEPDADIEVETAVAATDAAGAEDGAKDGAEATGAEVAAPDLAAVEPEPAMETGAEAAVPAAEDPAAEENPGAEPVIEADADTDLAPEVGDPVEPGTIDPVAADQVPDPGPSEVAPPDEPVELDPLPEAEDAAPDAATGEAPGAPDMAADEAGPDGAEVGAEAAGEEAAGEEAAQDTELEDLTETGEDAAPEDPSVEAELAPLPPTDIPAIRPRARPPLVVHPELAGIRPRPRPEIIPDAPSPE